MTDHHRSTNEATRFGGDIAPSLDDADDAETDWNLSLLQLLTGNFGDGWAGREARWNAKRAETSLTFPGPRWRGEKDIQGKTILIYMDEGLGDAIQFAAKVADFGAGGPVQALRQTAKFQAQIS